MSDTDKFLPYLLDLPNRTASEIEAYQVIRDYVKHEDNLINFRLSWMIAIQALILAASGVLFLEAIRDLRQNFEGSTFWVNRVLFLSPYVFFPIALAAFFGLRNATRTQKEVKYAREVILGLGKRYNSTFRQLGFPPVAGGIKEVDREIDVHYFPYMLQWLWGLALAFCAACFLWWPVSGCFEDSIRESDHICLPPIVFGYLSNIDL